MIYMATATLFYFNFVQISVFLLGRELGREPSIKHKQKAWSSGICFLLEKRQELQSEEVDTNQDNDSDNASAKSKNVSGPEVVQGEFVGRSDCRK